MRAFRSRLESGRSGVLSETSEQPATHTAAARIAGRRRPMKTMRVLTFSASLHNDAMLCKRVRPLCKRGEAIMSACGRCRELQALALSPRRASHGVQLEPRVGARVSAYARPREL